MNWYYTLAGQTYGPLSETDLDALVQAGTLQPTTLVWQKGMANWLTYSEARGSAPATAAPVAAPATGLRVAGSSLRVHSEPQADAPPVMEEAGCSQCGGVFPKEQVGEFGGVSVCAGCRPALMQRVRTSANTPHYSLNYAGFWIRLFAMIADSLCLDVLIVIVCYANGATWQKFVAGPPFDELAAALGRAILVMIVLFPIYDIGCTAWMGGTPGKRLLGLRVVTADGIPISFLRATARFLVKPLSNFLLIGYIMAGFDKEKRALHDMICGTRVIKE